MKKDVIFLNGPPRSGKDTLAEKIVALLPNSVKHVKFANEVKVGTHLKWNVPLLEPNSYENVKDIPLEIFGGMSPREAYIQYSEEEMKPKYGNDIFGKKLYEEIDRSKETIFVVSDSGFEEEALPIMENFDCTLVKIIRSGTSFEKDSRSYWVNKYYPDVINVTNNGREIDLGYSAVMILKKVLDNFIKSC